MEIENREYQSRRPVIENDRYKKIKRAVNTMIIKSKQFLCINFNPLVFTLGSDGVHFDTRSKHLIREKLIMNIRKVKENQQ